MIKPIAKTQAKKSPARKSTRSPADINRRREWRFFLPLRATIKGQMAQGEEFQEEATLDNISSTGAYFSLDSGLIVGSKLNLTIDLPKKLTEGKKMKLHVGGLTIRLEKPGKKAKKQGVAVRFSKEFKFIGDKN